MGMARIPLVFMGRKPDGLWDSTQKGDGSIGDFLNTPRGV